MFEGCFFDLGSNFGTFGFNFGTLKRPRGAMERFWSQKSSQRSKIEPKSSKSSQKPSLGMAHVGHNFVPEGVKERVPDQVWVEIYLMCCLFGEGRPFETHRINVRI